MSFVSVAKTKRGNHVWRDEGGAGPLIYVSGMAVDGDGSPHCYHPDNKGWTGWPTRTRAITGLASSPEQRAGGAGPK